jgi:hypothetical protein
VLSLTTQHLVDRHGDLLTVADLISPDLRDYVATTSAVRDQIEQHQSTAELTDRGATYR